MEFAIRQLVEVAVRALSPGINDPYTAISVLDRLGVSLCDVACRELANGVTRRDQKIMLVVPAMDYDGLVGAMFNMIRQNAAGHAAVLIRMLEVLTAVASCEKRTDRMQVLRRHAFLVSADAERTIKNESDLEDVRRRHAHFEVTSPHP